MNVVYKLSLIFLMSALIVVCSCDNAPLDGNDDNDDTSFIVYQTENGLADNWVTDIAVDNIRSGVWFSTRNGLSFYSNVDSTFITYGADTDIPDMEMYMVTVDNGAVWVGTTTGAAYMPLNDSLFHALPHMENLVHPSVTGMVYTYTNNGTRWFGTKGGISSQTMSGWTSYTTVLGSSSDITSLIRGPENDIWAGSTNGIAVWNGVSWDLTVAAELPSTFINTLYADWQGGVWAGTSNVASYWNGENWTLYGTADGLPATGITAFVRDSDGVLWAGSNSGVYFSGIAGWHPFTLPANAGLQVTSIAWDSATRSLWIGTKTGVVQYIATKL